jgi:hypothetical protein
MRFLQLLIENKKQVNDSKARIDEAKRQSSVAARHLDRNMQSPKPAIPPPHNTPTTQPLYVPDLVYLIIVINHPLQIPSPPKSSDFTHC